MVIKSGTIKRYTWGEPELQTCIGNIHKAKKYVPQNDSEAAKWYSRATRNSYAPTFYHLGQAYQHGRGVNRDPKKAFKNYYFSSIGGYGKALSED